MINKYTPPFDTGIFRTFKNNGFFIKGSSVNDVENLKICGVRIQPYFGNFFDVTSFAGFTNENDVDSFIKNYFRNIATYTIYYKKGENNELK